MILIKTTLSNYLTPHKKFMSYYIYPTFCVECCMKSVNNYGKINNVEDNRYI